MTAPIATFNLSATVSAVSGPIAIGDAVVPIGGVFYKATPANLSTAAMRAQGVAMTAWSASTTGAVVVQNVGIIDTLSTALGAGAASWVRVSTVGRLERATVAGADDVVGYCSADGTLFSLFGIITAAIANGSGGGFTPPTGTGFVTVTGGVLDGASLAQPIAASKVVQATGTGIPHVVAGALAAASSLIVDADVTSVGVSKLTGLGANVATFLGTPSGANLAAALTSALPVSRGGTGLTALTIPASALLVGTTDLQTLTNKTLADPVITSTRINNATTGAQNNVTLAGTTGTRRRVFFTNAGGATVSGFDATGVADGTILVITALGAGSVSLLSASGLSSAANQITTNSNFTMVVTTGSRTELEYDGTNALWRATDASAI